MLGPWNQQIVSPTTSSFLLNKAEINSVLHQKWCTAWPQPYFEVEHFQRQTGNFKFCFEFGENTSFSDKDSVTMDARAKNSIVFKIHKNQESWAVFCYSYFHNGCQL